MKKYVDKIYDALKGRKVDWDNVEAIVKSIGNDINQCDGEETILSELYNYNSRDGRVNKKLTEIFLKHGFDVRGNNGLNGASCLSALCWSSYDQYILETAELILHDKPNSERYILDNVAEDGIDVLGDIEMKMGYWMTGEYDSANMFIAYYQMIQRAQQEKDYLGIRAFRNIVGKCVTKVEKAMVCDQEKEEYREVYLLHCSEKILIADSRVEFYVNPYIKENVISIDDVSQEFAEVIGSKVRGLRYMNNSLAKLSFDNEKAILVGNSGNNVTQFQIVSAKLDNPLRTGMEIQNIKLWGSLYYAESVRCFKEHTIVFETMCGTYGLYDHETDYGEGVVRLEKFKKEMTQGVRRKLKLQNLVIQHIEYNGSAIKWMVLACDEGFLYIVATGFAELAMFLCPTLLEFEEVPRAMYGVQTQGYKKMNVVKD